MRSRDFLVFLGLEVIAIVWAGAVFSLLSNRLVAGAMAGTYFLLLGLIILLRMRRQSTRWKSPTFYLALVHVFGITLPMLVSRFLQAGLGFENVQILGLSGPAFHRMSTIVFTLLMLATAFDWWLLKRAEKQPAQ